MNFDYTKLQLILSELSKCNNFLTEFLRTDAFIIDDYQDEQDEKIVVYSVTSDKFDMLRASLKSLYYNSAIDRVIVITDNEKLPDDFPKDIELVHLNEAPDFLSKTGENINTKYTYFCLLRVGFHKMFPNLNKILSLDYDTIIRKDISDLWNINLGSNYYVGGVLEPRRSKMTLYGYNPNSGFLIQSDPSFKKVEYINSGVMLMNLMQLRKDGTGDKMINMINEIKLSFPEQDAINAICHRHIYPLPSEYNSMYFADPVENPKIIHFAATEKKFDNIDVEKYLKLSWKEIKERREVAFSKSLDI